MKKIVLIALLVAAGCSKKGSAGGSGGECEAAMTKGTDSLLTTVKTRAGNPQAIESLTEMVGKMKATLTTRCTEDKWSADAVDCFSKLTSQAELRACEQKLSEEQRNKLRGEMRQLMGSMRMGPGHPPALGGSAAPPAAPGTPPAGEPPPAAAPPATGGTGAPAAPPAPPAEPAAPPAAGGGSSASGW